MIIEPTKDEYDLADKVESSLEARLENCAEISADELSRVRELNHRLVPSVDIDIEEKTSERLRALAKLSQTDLKPPRLISSHRPIIGPMIVKAKQALWPLINGLLRDTFRAQREYNELLLEEYLHSLSRK